MRERLERSIRGDREAFSELVELHEGVVMAYAHHLTGSSVEADELAQGTFVEAFRSLARLQDPDRFESWLKGICRNLHRRRQQERMREPSMVDLDHLAAEPTVDAQASSWLGGLSAAELFEVVSAELQSMPEPARAVLLLRHYSGLSCKEIAGKLGLPVGTVTMRLSRGHRHLRAALTRQLKLSGGDAP